MDFFQKLIVALFLWGIALVFIGTAGIAESTTWGRRAFLSGTILTISGALLWVFT